MSLSYSLLLRLKRPLYIIYLCNSIPQCIPDILLSNEHFGPGLWRLSPLFRSPLQIAKLNEFLVPDALKSHVLECFATGFISHFEYPPPAPWGHVENYALVKDPEGVKALRKRMKKEVLGGRIIGGPGWSATTVRQFFGGADFYGIPCNATEKNGDPRGRIVHDYGYFPKGSYSINATHSSTTVKYPALRERVAILQDIYWYVKADLANGFRQFGTHPKDWRYQVYCNGPREHYIDLACPFGKTNSTIEFCPPVALFAKSVVANYTSRVTPRTPTRVLC